jgi:hexosaminidase
MKCRPELTEKGSIREGEIFGLYPGKYQPLPYGGYYTHEDVHEIVRYAAERHITVIPEIDIPGLLITSSAFRINSSVCLPSSH